MTAAPRPEAPQTAASPGWEWLGIVGAALLVGGAGPAYMPLVWVGVLWLTQRPGVPPGADLALVVLGGVLGALPAFLAGDPIPAGAQALGLMLFGITGLVALGLIHQRSAWGLGLGLVPLLLSPWLPGLLGLPPLALLLGHLRHTGAYRLGGRALPLALLFGTVILLPLALLTPRQDALAGLSTPPATQAAGPPESPQAPGAATPAGGGVSGFEVLRRFVVGNGAELTETDHTRIRRLFSALTVTMLLLLLVQLAALVQLLRIRARTRGGGRGFHWTDPVVLAGFALLVASLLLFAMEATGTGAALFGAGTGDAASGGGTGGSDGDAGLGARLIAALLAVFTGWQALVWVGLGTLLTLLLRLRFAGVFAGADAEGGAVPPAAPLPEPAERVRRAYAAVLRAAREAGLGRRRSETPAEWAARLDTMGVGGGDLRALTAAYVGVRYGQTPDERVAGEAETAAGRLQEHLRQHAEQTAQNTAAPLPQEVNP